MQVRQRMWLFVWRLCGCAVAVTMLGLLWGLPLRCVVGALCWTRGVCRG